MTNMKIFDLKATIKFEKKFLKMMMKPYKKLRWT